MQSSLHLTWLVDSPISLNLGPRTSIPGGYVRARGDVTCLKLPLSCRLTDHAPLVRRNALTVLTHLILNDMVKVRGQISLMAQCLEDPDTKIADLAKLFFYELSRKVR